MPPSCIVVALHIAGRRNSVADALSRFTNRARGLDPRPHRELRPKYRREVTERCGVIDVDMLARDDGSDARGVRRVSVAVEFGLLRAITPGGWYGGFRALIWWIWSSRGGFRH